MREKSIYIYRWQVVDTEHAGEERRDKSGRRWWRREERLPGSVSLAGVAVPTLRHVTGV